MRSLQAFRYLLSGIVIATGTISIVGAVEIPKPTVTVNVPKVQIQRPTINVPKPAVNVPKPTVNVAKPVVAKPAVSTAPGLASSKSDITIKPNNPGLKLPDKGSAPAVGTHDDLKTVSLPKNGSASTISSSSSGADKLKSGGLPTAVPGASKSTGLNPGQNNPAKKQDKPLMRAMSPARLMATGGGDDDDDDDSGGVALSGASRLPGARLPGAKGANSKIQPKVRPMSLARLATGDDDDDDDSSGSMTPTSKPSNAKAKVAAPQPKPVIKAKAAKPAKASWGVASGDDSGDDDDDSSGDTPAPQQQASMGDSGGDDDDSGDDSSGQGTGSSGSNGNLPGNVTVSSDGKSATATGSNGVYANATANSDGSVTVKTNNGNVTLSQQQLAAVANGDLSSIQGLMGNTPSMSMGAQGRSPAPVADSTYAPSVVDRVLMNLPSIPQPVVDAVAGFGDAASFGGTKYIRSIDGTAGFVNTNSDAYVGGKIAGTVDSFFVGSAAFNTALRGAGFANTLYHFTSVEAAASIAETGAVANSGLWGSGVYTTSINSRALATIYGARNTEAVVTLTQEAGQIVPTGWPFVFRVIPK